EEYAAAPPCTRSQFSSGVSGQTQRANSTQAPQAAAGRWIQASHRQRATNSPPRATKSTNATWKRTVASARNRKTTVAAHGSTLSGWHVGQNCMIPARRVHACLL